MKLDVCPNCECDDLSDRWVAGRKLQQKCNDCGWKSESRIPETIPIRTSKIICINRFNGFEYEVFDRYGHIMIHSRSYSSRDEMIKNLEEDMKRSETDVNAGPYTAVIWNDVIEVQGEVYKSKKEYPQIERFS
jgi:hypothetical protein